MAAPHPLTLCPPAQLDWSRPNTPAATDFGDIYFSTDGGLEETRTVFLQGCGLPEGWQETERFVIGELGFGSGLNFLATWQMWETTKPANGHLHFVSIEKFPFDQDQLRQALSAWPELSKYADRLVENWPGRVKGFHRLHFEDITLTLIHDDIDNALAELEMKANAWFLDGFSPSRNPDMWSSTVMQNLARLSEKGAKLATFTVAGDVRRALQNAGFTVERKTGFGRKRHRLEAYLEGATPKFQYAVKQAHILGAGIGGLSFAKALQRRGLTPFIIEDPDHIAASGNAAALVKPRLDLQDRPESRFFLSSYLYAQEIYRDTIINKGVIQLPKNTSDEKRHQKFLAQSPLPTSHLSPGDDGALYFPQGLVIDPMAFKKHALSEFELKLQKVLEIPNSETPFFIAAGYGIKSLLKDWPLRFSRGQISWARTAQDLDRAISYGGYGIAFKEGVLIGATHDRLVTGENPFTLKPSDDDKNLNQFQTYVDERAENSTQPSRASIRVTSADTLPVIGQTKDGHFVLTGLGSRGFVFAPLLAEAIISHYFGDPLPIAKSVWERFSIERFKASAD